MIDRKLAESLGKTDPNLTWAQAIQKQLDRGIEGNDVWKGTIESSQKSRSSVNNELGIK